MSISIERINSLFVGFLVANTLEEVYETILKDVSSLVGKSHASILLLNPDSGKFDRVHTNQPHARDVSPLKNGFIKEAYSSQKPILIPLSSLVKIHPEFVDYNISSIILVPLSYKNERLGVLSIETKNKKSITVTEKEFLQLFGAMASLAIRNAQSYNDMQVAIRMRDEFISLAAHELRTPLTAIHGYIQLLHKRAKYINKQENAWIDELNTQTYRLIYLVNELLEITRITANRQSYAKRKVHFSPILERVVERYIMLNKDSKIAFSEELNSEEDMIIGDADKLDQLVSHILDNAVKFSKVGSYIYISVKKKNENIILEVENRSNEIEKDELLNLFQRFYKGKNNEGTGMGLGLYLAQQIAINHEGSIKITSNKNKTRVTCILPTQ